MKSSLAEATGQLTIFREGGGPTAENFDGSGLLFGCFFGNHETNGEGVPNTYSLASYLTGNEAGERLHHALGFSVAMRFEGFDDLHLANAAVFKNDKTELDAPLHAVSYCLFWILEVLRHVSQQGMLTTGENRQLLGDGAHFRASFFRFDGKSVVVSFGVLRTQCRCHGREHCHNEEMFQHRSSNLGVRWGVWVHTRDKVSNNCFNLKTYAAFFRAKVGAKANPRTGETGARIENVFVRELTESGSGWGGCTKRVQPYLVAYRE